MKTDEKVRKNEQIILSRLADIGQVRLAEYLNLSESAISNMKKGEIERIANILAALNLKVVDEKDLVGDSEMITAVGAIAKKAINRYPNLLWGE